jgi:hypothetical protein
MPVVTPTLTELDALDQVPPGTGLDRVMLEPTHIMPPPPVIAPGAALTVTTAVETPVPQLEVTV